MPQTCPGVPDEILNPRNMWSDREAFDEQARKLRDLFHKNYEDKDFHALGIVNVM